MLRNVTTRRLPLLTLRAAAQRSATKATVVRTLSTQSSNAIRNALRASNKNCILFAQTPQNNGWSYTFARAYSSLPDHIKVPLPALSPTMEKGAIVSWEKKEGDKLNEGDLLCEIETDKATMGFETPEEGYLAKILLPAGTKDVAIGKLLCIIVSEESQVAAFKDFKDDGAAAAAPAPPPPPPAAAAAAPPPPPPPAPVAAAPTAAAPSAGRPLTAVEQRGERVYASPLAKRLAEVQRLRLQGKGSGVFDSIKSSDLAGLPAAGAQAAAGVPAGAAFVDIPVTNIRGVIAKRLLESKQQIPHYYVSVECQIDKLLAFRAHVNKKYEKKGVRVSVNDFIIKATAAACRKVPESNSSWMGDVIRQYDAVDVSVAVSTDRGLITPIIFGADRKGVIDISKEVKELAGRARENKLKPQEFQGGTISVSNLGMFGVTNFTAIINPPQSCILAVGTTGQKLIADPDNIKGFREVNVLQVTLSSDHRTVDGAVAAQWLQYFRDFVEDPQNMIL